VLYSTAPTVEVENVWEIGTEGMKRSWDYLKILLCSSPGETEKAQQNLS
jgi:hypothetical protein